MALNKGRIRCAVDVSQNTFADSLTGGNPDFWRAEDVQFELAFFFGSGVLADLSEINEITLLIKEASRDGDPLVSVTIDSGDINTGLTVEKWEAGTGQHCTIAISKDYTNFDLAGDDSKRYWLVLLATTSNDPSELITLGGVNINVLESGYTNAVASPPEAAPTLPYGLILQDQNLNKFLVTIHSEGGIPSLSLAPPVGTVAAPELANGVILHDQSGGAWLVTLRTDEGITTFNITEAT